MLRRIPVATLIRKEVDRFWQWKNDTIFPPIITTVLFILIFGYSLGSRIQEISGLPYIVFILPGLVALGVITNAYANTAFSLYHSRFDQSIDNLIASPLSPIELVFAYIFGGIARAMVIGLITLLIGVLALPMSTVSHPWLVLLYIIGSGIFFACWGIVTALRATSWEAMATTTNFVITPLVYLGGVFYSIDLLPPFWRTISLFNPLFYMVDGVRFAVVGTSDISWKFSLTLTWCLALCGVILCVYLFRIGYKLVR